MYTGFFTNVRGRARFLVSCGGSAIQLSAANDEMMAATPGQKLDPSLRTRRWHAFVI